MRSRYIKRRHIRNIFMAWLREWLFNAAVLIVLATTILLIWRAFNPLIPFSVKAETVAAFRVPAQAMSNLHSLSQWYDIPFDRLLAIYSVSNNFFPEGAFPAVEIDILKSNYVTGFNRLRRQYVASDILPYFDLFEKLVFELEYFPIPWEYEYMFSDTWDHGQGTNILDRANIRGRIPVFSMTAGQVHRAGWHSKWGYHVVLVTKNGSRILYAHLHSLDEGIAVAQHVSAGQSLGLMGNSGEANAVHLHIGISPRVPFAENFWINPYPFLRHLEEKNYSAHKSPQNDAV